MKKSFAYSVILTTCLSMPAMAKTESIDSIKVAENIHLLRANSNISNTSSVLWVGPDGVVLIDTGFDGSEALIREKIAALGGKKVDYVTSTHVHRDHTEQYPNFLGEAIAIVPEQQRAELISAEFMKGKLPAVTFSGSTGLHLNNDTLTLSTLPTQVGHTDGDLLAYFEKAKVLYVGDYLFINGYPIIDKHLGDLEGYLSNIKHILDTYPADTKVLAGHTTFDGAPYGAITMQEYGQYYQDLRDSISHIKSQMKVGKDAATIIEQGMPAQFAKYKTRPTFVRENRWIEHVVKYYSGKQ